MADDLSSFLREMKQVSSLFKQMTKDAREVRMALNGAPGGGYALGSSGKQVMASPSMAKFGFGATQYNEPHMAAWGVYGPAPKRGVRTFNSAGQYPNENDQFLDAKRTAASKMTSRVFRSMGMGNLLTDADGGGLNRADIAYNQRVAEAARTERFNRSAIGRSMSLAQGDWKGALGGTSTSANRTMFGQLPSYNQNLIMSAMPTPMDSLRLMSGMQNALNSFLPDVSEGMSRATGYYGATLAGGNRLSRGQTIGATFNTLNKIGGISSVGSDAAVAQLLAQRGMTASNDPNSTYQQTVRTIGHAARYLNINNEAAAASVEHLTSGAGAGSMLRNLGIYTADLATGKEKTQGQIFEEIAQRLTAGRRGATVEQTQASIRRGALGATINGMFQGDETTAQMFKQYMIDRAGGKSMDLANESAMTSLYGGQYDKNRNPLNAQLTQVSAQTEALGMAQDEYIKGIEAATGMLVGLAKAAGGVATVMGMPAAMIQNVMANRQVSGMVSGASSMAEYASKGIAGITEAIIGGEYDTPWGAGVAAATVGTIAAGTALGAAPALGSTAAQVLMGLGSKAYSTGSGRTGGGTGGGASPARGTTIRFSNPTTTTQLSEGGGYKAGVHGGWDYAVSEGNRVMAIYDGTVDEVGYKPEWGNYIILDHGKPNGIHLFSRYQHLTKWSVGQNTTVKSGQTIGVSGKTGDRRWITGAHLHFAISEGSKDNTVNPGKYLNAIGGAGTYAYSGEYVPAANGAAVSTGISTPDNTSAITGVVSPSSAPSSLSATDTAAAGSYVTSLMSKAAPSPQAQAAISALTGLSSGNVDSIRAAISSLSAGLGVNLSGASYTGAYTSALGAGVGTSTAASLVGQQTSSGGAKTVNINLSLPNASATEAEKFAILVKQFLEDDTLQKNTSSR